MELDKKKLYTKQWLMMSSPKVTATKHLIFLKIYSLTRKAQFKPLIEYEIRTEPLA